MVGLSILLKCFAFQVADFSWKAASALALVSLVIDAGMFARHRRKRGRPLRGGLLEVVLVNVGCLLMGLLLLRVADAILVRYKEGIPALAQLVAWLLNGAGLPVSTAGGSVHLATMAGPLAFPISYDNLAVTPLLLLWGFGLIYLLLMKSSHRQFAGALGWYTLSVAAAGFLRAVFAVGLFVAACYFIKSETEELPMLPFIHPIGMTLSLVPFLILFFPLLGGKGVFSLPAESAGERVREPSLAYQLGIENRKRFLVCTVILAALLAGFCWEPVGTQKNGKVLINTFHTKWSRTDREYDKKWFGSGSGYNYYNVKKFFEIFYDVSELHTRISDEALADVSVLMIYDPSEAFTEEELEAVERFVKRGGGLLLVGDHTNVFGSTSHLNMVCENFGFQYRDDVLFDKEADFFQIVFPGKTSSHLLTGIDLFKLRGPCSIRPTSIFTSSVMEVGNSKSLRAIYSVNNFYPRPADDPVMKHGLFSVAVASHVGKGRVLAFGDSTVFSQFEIFYPGKYEFLSNGVAWLNHRDSVPHGPVRATTACLLFGFMVYLFAGASRPRSAFSWCMVGLLLFTVLPAGVTLLRRQQTHPPEIRSPIPTLFFVADDYDDKWGLRIFTPKGDYADRYDIFTQWVMRNQMLPAIYMPGNGHSRHLYDRFTTTESVDTGVVLLIRNEEELKALAKADSELVSRNQRFIYLLADGLEEQPVGEALIQAGYLTQEALGQAEPYEPIEDVKRIEHGGRLHFLVFKSKRFSDRSMGFSEKVFPNKAQKARYEQQYRLLDDLFGLEREEAAAAGDKNEEGT